MNCNHSQHTSRISSIDPAGYKCAQTSTPVRAIRDGDPHIELVHLTRFEKKRAFELPSAHSGGGYGCMRHYFYSGDITFELHVIALNTVSAIGPIGPIPCIHSALHSSPS